MAANTGRKYLWVAVEWDDAHGGSREFTEADMEHRAYRFITGGVLIRSDDTGVSLARDLGEDGVYRDHAFIPRQMVVREWVVGPLLPLRRRKQRPSPETATTLGVPGLE